MLFVGKSAKTWYFQKDAGGQTQRVLIGRFPLISANAARQTALGYALEWGRGAGRKVQTGAPALAEALDAYLARPKLRSEAHRSGVRQQIELHLKDWLRLPLDEITKSMVVGRHRSMAKTPSSANHTQRFLEVSAVRDDGPPMIKIGRNVRYRVSDLREWIDSCRIQEARK